MKRLAMHLLLTACTQELEPMSETWTQSQSHFQSLEAIDRLRDSLREEHGLMLQVRSLSHLRSGFMWPRTVWKAVRIACPFTRDMLLVAVRSCDLAQNADS